MSASFAWGQAPASLPAVVGGGAIPQAVKTASIVDAAGEEQIKQFIKGELDKFRAVNTNEVPKAREAIIAEAKGGSAAYLAKYAEIVNTEILKILGNV